MLNGAEAYAAIYPTALTGAQVLAHYQQGFTGYPIQDSGARIAAVLSALGWPAGDEAIATGISNVSQPTGTLTTTKVLTYLQQVEDTEHGYLYVSADGKITFLNRYSPLGTTPAVTLGDGSGEIPYKPGPDFGLDNIDLFNATSVQRVGGAVFRAVDATSKTRYGVESSLVEPNLLLTAEAESLSRSQWNIQHYANPLLRMRSIVVDVLGDVPNRFTQIALRELRDRVTAKRRPYTIAGGFPANQFSQDSFIEGIEHDISVQPLKWEVTLRLSPADSIRYWVLGDATYGVLGTTTSLAW